MVLTQPATVLLAKTDSVMFRLIKENNLITYRVFHKMNCTNSKLAWLVHAHVLDHYHVAPILIFLQSKLL